MTAPRPILPLFLFCGARPRPGAASGRGESSWGNLR